METKSSTESLLYNFDDFVVIVGFETLIIKFDQGWIFKVLPFFLIIKVDQALIFKGPNHTM